ncbi:MAG: patatin-like phospholipase family protein [Sandaracinaceae bacterium]|nr:patatin-like phospholipase family protein [Sandaracinaceae bacterium]
MTIAIVLGGGGSLGAFSVGVARWLLVDKGIRPDIVTGTSTGALAAVLVASGEISLLSDLYANVATRDVLHRSFLGDLGVVVHGYANSVDPLRDLIASYLTEARRQRIVDRGVKLQIAATNLQRGRVEYGTEADDLARLRKFVLASCCQPALMPTVEIDGADYLDGGVMQMLPLQRALDLGATKIYACATSAARADRGPITRRFPNSPGTDVFNYTLRRAVLLMTDQGTDDTLALARARGVDVTAFRPATTLAADPLAFDPARMAAMVDEGYLRAKAILP